MCTAMVILVSIFVTFFSLLPCVVISSPNYSTFTKIQMPLGVTGPESAGFKLWGEGPYVTVADGRILKWQGPRLGFKDFARTSPKRTKALCDNTTDLELGPICGRPLALSFNYLSGILYIADAYFGLLEVDSLIGGLAKVIANSTAEGVPFKFLTGVDVDSFSGNVYFSDVSDHFDIRDYQLGNVKSDSTGRFMKYNPFSKRVTVLKRNLMGGGGPAVSIDGSYVLVPEFGAGNIYKYWLFGPKANTAELLLNVTGNVNKIKRGGTAGEYWVATILIQSQGSLKVPQGLRIDGNGKVLQTVSFEAQFNNKSVSVVQEEKGALYVGSRFTDFICKYT